MCLGILMLLINFTCFLFGAVIQVSLSVLQDTIIEGETITDFCVTINPGIVELLSNGFVRFSLSTTPSRATGMYA